MLKPVTSILLCTALQWQNKLKTVFAAGVQTLHKSDSNVFLQSIAAALAKITNLQMIYVFLLSEAIITKCFYFRKHLPNAKRKHFIALLIYVILTACEF